MSDKLLEEGNQLPQDLYIPELLQSSFATQTESAIT